MLRPLAVASACAALFACDAGGPPPADRAFLAAGVLAVDLPPATEAVQRGEWSLFTLDPGVRSPRQIEIARLGRTARPVELVRSRSDGGSGGAEHRLRGAVRACGDVFAVTCSAQAEHVTPDLDWCRRAIASLRCRLRGR